MSFKFLVLSSIELDIRAMIRKTTLYPDCMISRFLCILCRCCKIHDECYNSLMVKCVFPFHVYTVVYQYKGCRQCGKCQNSEYQSSEKYCVSSHIVSFKCRKKYISSLINLYETVLRQLRKESPKKSLGLKVNFCTHDIALKAS